MLFLQSLELHEKFMSCENKYSYRFRWLGHKEGGEVFKIHGWGGGGEKKKKITEIRIQAL